MKSQKMEIFKYIYLKIILLQVLVVNVLGNIPSLHRMEHFFFYRVPPCYHLIINIIIRMVITNLLK